MSILTAIIRTVIIYFLILFFIRLMGKREIGKLSPFDLVVAIMIAEIAVFSIEDDSISLIVGIIPVVILVILEIAMAIISLKSNYLRGLINGRPQILIKKGKIDYQNLKKTKYSINDLLLQLRKKDVFDIEQVELGILETSGDFSVIKKGTSSYGFPVIIDGQITSNEEISGVNRNWVENKLEDKEFKIKDVLLATVNENKELKFYFKDEI